MSSKQLQRSLYEALTGRPLSEFDLSRFMTEHGVSRKEAEQAALRVFNRYCAQFAADGVISEKESYQIQRLAAALEISTEKRDAVLKGAKEKVVHEAQSKAEADGVITDKEQAALDQLRDSLGLPPPRPASAVSTVVPIVADPANFQCLMKSGRCRWSGSPADLQSRLASLESLDREFEKKEAFWKILSFASAGGAIVFCAVVFVVPEGKGLGVLMTAVLLAAALMSLWMKLQRGRLNVDDRRYIIAGELLRHLKQDMSADAPVELALDFNGYRQSNYRTGQSGRQTSYAVPWYSMKGRFVDGTRIRMSITQIVKRKEEPKRKYTKVKEVFREKVSLIVQVRAKTPVDLAKFPSHLSGATVPRTLKIRQAKVQGGQVSFQAITFAKRRVRGRYGTTGEDADQRTSDPDTYLGLLLACFSALGHCRTARRNG